MTAFLAISIVILGTFGGLGLLFVWAQNRSSSDDSNSPPSSGSRSPSYSGSSPTPSRSTTDSSSSSSSSTKTVELEDVPEPGEKNREMTLNGHPFRASGRSPNGRFAVAFGVPPQDTEQEAELKGNEDPRKVDISGVMRSVARKVLEAESEGNGIHDTTPLALFDLESGSLCFYREVPITLNLMTVNDRGDVLLRGTDIGNRDNDYIVHAYSSDGEHLGEFEDPGRHFREPLFSDSGRRAAVLHPPFDEYGGTLIDFRDGSVTLLEMNPDEGKGELRFEGERLHWTPQRRGDNREWFRVRDDGTLGDGWEDWKANKPYRSCQEALSIIWDEVQSDEPDWDLVEELLDAHEDDLPTDRSDRAKYHRHRGELLEARDADPEEILEHWEKALELDESVGIKRRAKKVRREVS